MQRTECRAWGTESPLSPGPIGTPLNPTAETPAPVSVLPRSWRGGSMQACACGREVWAQSRTGGLPVVSPHRVGPRGPGWSLLGPTRALIFTHSQGRGSSGAGLLTTCLHPGWSGRWGPRRVRSAVQLSSHHCRGRGKVSSSSSPAGPRNWHPNLPGLPILQQRPKGGWTRPTA